MTDNLRKTIKTLVEAWGPSGYEHHVRALIEDMVKDDVDEMHVDALGNLICRVGSGGSKIMVAAHMDEIGVMATYVEPNSGYLRFEAIGGLLHNTLMGARVHFEDGTVGIIGVHDAWGSNRRSLPDGFASFYIDVSDGNGSTPIPLGTPAAFWQTMEERGTRLVGKAMDDRIGCAVAIETMRQLNKETPHELYFVFTVQEEVGLRGARTAAYGVDPEIGIALDVTLTGDAPKSQKMAVKLGEGAAIKVHDNGVVVPPQIRDWMVERAEADGIPYQLEVLNGGTTDAAGIQSARAGVPSGCISIPCRFVHTPSETVDVTDVEASVRLLKGLLSHPLN